MNVNPRIFSAFVVGAVLVGTTYFLAPNSSVSQKESSVSVVPAPAREYITIKDSDNDSIPDWKEGFRSVEPIEISQNIEESEIYKQPETLTGRVAIDLFTDTVRAKKYGPLGQSQEDMIKGATRQISESGTDTLYTESYISVSSDTSIESLQNYGNRIAEIAIVNKLPEGTRREIDIIQDAVYSENNTVLEELDPIIKTYRSMRDSMMVVPVPSTVVKEHLDLLNAFNALLIDLEAMRGYAQDPLYTMIRMKRYFDDAVGITSSIINLYTKLTEHGAQWTSEDLVPRFVTIKK